MKLPLMNSAVSFLAKLWRCLTGRNRELGDSLVLPPSSETKEPATAAPVAGGLDGAIREEKLVQPTEAVALAESFDAGKIASLRWRQGAICGAGLVAAARGHAPASVTISDTDWLIVTSHDCDVVNSSLSKEPVVELLRGQVLSKKSPDNQQDDAHVYVADERNGRVLIWNTSTPKTGQAADVVLGASDFVTSGSFSSVRGLDFDQGTG